MEGRKEEANPDASDATDALRAYAKELNAQIETTVTNIDEDISEETETK